MISRPIKKIVFGAIYLTIFFLIGLNIYDKNLKPAPSCFDNIRNQNEAGIDCGGSCIACEVLKLKPVRVVGSVKLFSLSSGKTVFLAEAMNPNPDYFATDALYNFLVYDNYDRVIEKIGGGETFYPLEQKYIYVPNVEQPGIVISKVVLEFSKPAWQNAKGILKPALVLSGETTTEVDGGNVRVTGSIQNQGALSASGVKITAIIADQFGLELFVSQTIVPLIPGFEKKNFVVIFPTDSELARQTDPKATKVFFSSQ